MQNLNKIYLRRYGKLTVNTNDIVAGVAGTKSADQMIHFILTNIADYGYTLSGELMSELKKLSNAELADYYSLIDSTLAKMLGADVQHIPLFRNFPDDIPNDEIYFTERVVGYLENILGLTDDSFRVLSCGHAINTQVFDLSNFGGCPICQMSVDMEDLDDAKERPALDEITPLNIIGLGSQDELESIFANLVSANTSISEADRADIEAFFDEYGDNIVDILPTTIPFIETKIFVGKLITQKLSDFEVALTSLLRTATDVLRFATALSDGDISLADNSKFRNFSRPERRALLAVLNKVAKAEDMLRYKTRWIALGEKLHPGDYSGRFKNAYTLFQKLRNNEKIKTFAGKVEHYLALDAWADAMHTLSARPTEYARRLDHLLRISNESDAVVENFAKIASDVPTRVLLQMLGHFGARDTQQDLRIIMPKGNLAKVKAFEDERTVLSGNVCSEVVSVIEATLIERFKTLDPLGKVFIDNAFSKLLVPFSQRSASDSLKTIVRGSRVPFGDGEKDTVRTFVHWMEDGIRTDLDLSMTFYSEDWTQIGHISFTQLSYGRYAKHSGDKQSAPAPRGASEFIDVDIPKAIAKNIRYGIMQIYDYTGRGYTNLAKAFAGVMSRSKPKSGEIFDPRTVEQKFDITSEVQIAIPMIIDLYEREMIWTDISLKSNAWLHRCVENNRSNVELMGRAMSQLANVKVDLHTLFELHARARGEVVEDRSEADIVFANDGDVTPQHIDLIMSEFMI